MNTSKRIKGDVKQSDVEQNKLLLGEMSDEFSHQV
jgi:hypothetical protein